MRLKKRREDYKLGCGKHWYYPKSCKLGGGNLGAICGRGMRTHLYCGGAIKVPCLIFVHTSCCAAKAALVMLQSLFTHGKYREGCRLNVALARINHHLQPFAREWRHGVQGCPKIMGDYSVPGYTFSLLGE